MNLPFTPIAEYVNISRAPFLISGPCSAESEAQVLASCLPLKDLGASVLRAGVWKPRTRPNSFEGHGEKALPWVIEAKKQTGLPVAVEVATPAHVELALKYGIDILWIGARTTVNPFSVQDIADALRGVDVPVWIKNPVNPDLALWIGAIERVAGAGKTKIAAIHRGFSTTDTHYRNAPMWQIALALKTELPDLPLIGDPSHMGGKRAYLAELSQKFLDLNYDGLMIESHANPAEAWSDAAQQLTATDLAHLLACLSMRVGRQDNTDAGFQDELATLRQKIDHIDKEFIQLLRLRMNLVEQVCDYKIAHNVAIFQTERWNDIFQTRNAWAEELEINPAFVEEIYKLIYIESIRKHHESQKLSQPKNVI